MNKTIKSIASAMAIFALLITSFAPATTAFATDTDPVDSVFDSSLDTKFDLEDLELELPDPIVLEDIEVEEKLSSDESNTESKTTSSYSYTKCELSASSKNIYYGDSVTITWDTEGFDEIKLNGEVVSGNSGSKTFNNIQENTKFRLVAIDSNGTKSKCKQEVYVSCEQPEPPKKECELEVNKQVDKSHAVPGEHLTYTIKVENVGGADCTGGGVRILDVLDSNLTYISHQLTSNLSAGYGGNPVYTESNRTLRFNGGTLNPGESGTITVVGKINEPNQCGDFEIKNQAQSTARELNKFKDWSYSQIVKTNVDYDCDEPEEPVKPVCPYTVADGTVVDFGDARLFSNSSEAAARTTSNNVNLPAGDYAVRLVAWDGYSDRVNVSQPNERYRVVFANGDTIVAESNNTGDLADNVISAIYDAEVNSKITLSGDVNNVYGLHSVYPDSSSANSLSPICAVFIPEEVVPAPTCDLFTANPGTITLGNSATLTWETTNADQVFLNNGIGSVPVDGTFEVTPLADTTYVLTVIGAEDKTVDCEVPVKVSVDEVPVCEFFTATPGNLGVGGGDVTLEWSTLNAVTATITPNVGVVALTGSEVVNVTEATTFVLTAVDDNGDEVSCQAPVTIDDPEIPFSCEENVSFSASDTSISRGQDLTLTWSTTDVDTVSISEINATSLSGSETVSPSTDTTYVLTATRGDETVECPVSVTVSGGGGGGGGGGGSSLRCDLEISDTKVQLGEEITLEWDTTGAREITITDDLGEVLFTTDDFLSSEKEDYLDGEITIKPTRDTEFTILAERGSRDRECSVEVEVEDNVVVLQSRDQQPLVAGISLTQVPYTGFEAGPFMTLVFYALLIAWSLYITYLLVIRRQTVSADYSAIDNESIIKTENVEAMEKAEKANPEVFTASEFTPTMTHVTPINLPTEEHVRGYENHVEEEVEVTNPHQVDDVVVTSLENRAHEQNALLSSDAIRYFIGTTTNESERNEAIDSVISESKKTYPLEDGWIVINEPRMQNLCEVCMTNREETVETEFVPTVVPEGSSSLAEAIVTGNIVAAYSMIGSRPMFALADAAADLDSVYRYRRGGEEKVSEMLISETKDLSDEQIKSMISALTSAIDGTYTDEASAVKVAIMKAVKAIA